MPLQLKERFLKIENGYHLLLLGLCMHVCGCRAERRRAQVLVMICVLVRLKVIFLAFFVAFAD